MNTQEKIDQWAEVIYFLARLWTQAMEADVGHGEDLPDELSRAIADHGQSFRRLLKLAQKYGTPA